MKNHYLKTLMPSVGFLLTERLDTFYFYRFANKGEFRELWQAVDLFPVLSYGEATVERGFSPNEQVMIESLTRHSLTAQLIICDHVQSVGGVLSVGYSKQLLLSAASGRQKYHAFLDKKEGINLKRG